MISDKILNEPINQSELNKDYVLKFIDNNAEILLEMIYKCNQYDITFHNGDIVELFQNYCNIIKYEKIKHIV